MNTAFVRPGVIGSILCLAIVVTCSLPSGAKTAFQEELRPVSVPPAPALTPPLVDALLPVQSLRPVVADPSTVPPLAPAFWYCAPVREEIQLLP